MCVEGTMVSYLGHSVCVKCAFDENIFLNSNAMGEDLVSGVVNQLVFALLYFILCNERVMRTGVYVILFIYLFFYIY